MADDAATEATAESVAPAEETQQAAPQETATASTSDEQTEAQTAPATEGQSGEKENAEAKNEKQNAIDRRFSQLTQRAKDAEARADQAEQAARQADERLKFYEGQFKPQEDANDPFPAIDDPEVGYDPVKFQQRVAEWNQRHIADSTQSAFVEQQRAAAKIEAQQAQKALSDVFDARAAVFEESNPDFRQVVTAPNPHLSPQVKQLVAQYAARSEQGPAIAYHVAKNPDVAMSLSSMHPLHAVGELGRLEARLSTPAAPRTPSAPAPQKPLGGNAPVAKDPDKMSAEEYVRHRQGQSRG